jgi:integrase
VFTMEDGTPLHPDSLGRWFRAHVKRAKLPVIRLYGLRHTCSPPMLAAGVPAKVVSERLGHSTPAFTMTVYQHVLPGTQRDAVELVFGGIGRPPRRLKVVGA